MDKSTLFAQLQEAALQAAGAPVTVEGDGARVTLVPEHVEGLAVALRTAEVTVGASSEPLVEAGRAISARVTYLLEPLVVLEAVDDRVLLRSASPSGRGREIEFYELWLQREAGEDRAVLSRVQRQRGAGGQRTALPVTVTWEVLERLVGDLQVGLRGA